MNRKLARKRKSFLSVDGTKEAPFSMAYTWTIHLQYTFGVAFQK
jgi:hypothetical protein